MGKKYLLFAFIFQISITTNAQVTGLSHQSETWHLLDRIQTLNKSFDNNLFLADAPVSLLDVHQYLNKIQKQNVYNGFSKADNYDLALALSNSGEYQSAELDGPITSKYSVGKFYQKQTQLYFAQNKNFVISINPILGAQGGWEKNGDHNLLSNFTAGIDIKARYKDIVALELTPTFNSFTPNSFTQAWITRWNAVPGAAYFNQNGNRYSYWLPTGSVDVRILKNYMHLTLGYGTNFMGNGYRSLFLSDYSGPVGYAKLSTKIWKLQYENVYMILRKQHDIPGLDLYDNTATKYATSHHLSVNITKWLNIGAYEMVVFSRSNHFEFNYLNPIIFFRGVERSYGSPDKVALGFDAKAIVAKGVNVYGQFFLNEFESKNFFSGKGSDRNKWGAQLGFNYFDVAGISNLDIQGEINAVRPYTFQFRKDEGTATGNFSNANQPLGHPLGAGFKELIGIVKYKPLAKLTVDAQAMYYQQAVDSGSYNSGSDIFKNYNTIPTDRTDGLGFVNKYGIKTTCLAINLNVAYQLKPNLFVEVGGVHRHFKYQDNYAPDSKVNYLYAGFRLNLNRRNQIPF